MNFFKATETTLSYFQGTNEVLKVDANMNLKGDIVIKDANDDIQFRVYANGLVRAREVKVNLATIPPDYVFEKTYSLPTIKEVEQYISLHKHLPGVPSGNEMIQDGSIDISAMQFKLLEKVEELTLYIIQLKNENEELKKRICSIEDKK